MKFNGFQDLKMHVRKFQEEAIKFLHDTDMLAKLFSSSLIDDALKWYFSLPEKSIDKYEDLILQFIANFKYNFQDRTEFRDLCKLKKVHGQYLSDFVKKWKKVTNKVTATK